VVQEASAAVGKVVSATSSTTAAHQRLGFEQRLEGEHIGRMFRAQKTLSLNWCVMERGVAEGSLWTPRGEKKQRKKEQLAGHLLGGGFLSTTAGGFERPSSHSDPQKNSNKESFGRREALAGKGDGVNSL
jgi:hypothetical protein